MSDSEWKLVESAKQGDTHAFSLLYEKYYKDLYRFAVCYVKSVQTAEDVVSQAVLKAYENLPQLRKYDSFKSWLFQITANECRRVFRRQESFLEDTGWEEPDMKEQGFQIPELQEMLEKLSEEERLVVTLSVFAGYNSREIGRILHKKEGSVRSLKSRALAKLRDYIGEC
jgi:RNA polymerase sigma-70 factor (ECF subfamily)